VFGDNEQEGHCDSIEKSAILLDKQGLQDRWDKCLLITQIITPTRPEEAIKRTTRSFFFLSENAYVRIIRMTEDMADRSVNTSL